jgi:succinate dehydrogenase / fumarate reductase flavoprotein subunit
LHGARFRKESRGAHSHDDYPERNDKEWLVHTLTYLHQDSIVTETRDVIQTTLNDEVDPVPLAKRTY